MIFRFLSIVQISLIITLISSCSSEPIKVEPKFHYTPGHEKEFLRNISTLEYGYDINMISLSADTCGLTMPTDLSLWANDKVFNYVRETMKSHSMGYTRSILGNPVISIFADVSISETDDCLVQAKIYLLESNNNTKPVTTYLGPIVSYPNPGYIVDDKKRAGLFIEHVGGAVILAMDGFLTTIDNAKGQ